MQQVPPSQLQNIVSAPATPMGSVKPPSKDRYRYMLKKSLGRYIPNVGHMNPMENVPDPDIDSNSLKREQKRKAKESQKAVVQDLKEELSLMPVTENQAEHLGFGPLVGNRYRQLATRYPEGTLWDIRERYMPELPSSFDVHIEGGGTILFDEECEDIKSCTKTNEEIRLRCGGAKKKYDMFKGDPNAVLRDKAVQSLKAYDDCAANVRENSSCPAECYYKKEKKGFSKHQKDMLKFTEGLNKVTSTATAAALTVGKPILAAAATTVAGPVGAMAVNEAYDKMVEQPGYLSGIKEKSVFGDNDKVWDVVENAGKAATKVGEKTAARTDQIDPEKEAKDLFDKGMEEAQKEGKKLVKRGRKVAEEKGQELADRAIQEGQRRVDSGVAQAQSTADAYANRAQSTADAYANRAQSTADAYANRAQSTADTYANRAQSTADDYSNRAQRGVSRSQRALSNYQTYYTDDNIPYYYNTVTGVSQWEKPVAGSGIPSTPEKKRTIDKAMSPLTPTPKKKRGRPKKVATPASETETHIDTVYSTPPTPSTVPSFPSDASTVIDGSVEGEYPPDDFVEGFGVGREMELYRNNDDPALLDKKSFKDMKFVFFMDKKSEDRYIYDHKATYILKNPKLVVIGENDKAAGIAGEFTRKESLDALQKLKSSYPKSQGVWLKFNDEVILWKFGNVKRVEAEGGSTYKQRAARRFKNFMHHKVSKKQVKKFV